jgi:hypothetical protein
VYATKIKHLKDNSGPVLWAHILHKHAARLCRAFKTPVSKAALRIRRLRFYCGIILLAGALHAGIVIQLNKVDHHSVRRLQGDHR